jgi:putative membrane protein
MVRIILYVNHYCSMDRAMGSISMRVIKTAVFIFLAGGAGTAQAHVITAQTVESTWLSQWDLQPWLIFLLLSSLGLYLAGSFRLWKKAGYGNGLLIHEFIAFIVGWLMMVVALVSPLDALGSWLFSAHMLQHEMLMIVVAPLLVLSKPLVVWVWALPYRWRILTGEIIHQTWIAAPWKLLTHPLHTWILHAMALWLWHMPMLFEAALHNNNIHVLQHVSFLFSALLFWWSVIGVNARAGIGSAMISIFTTMLHTGALGVLLTLSAAPWYQSYDQTLAFGINPLEDQQLGGLIMWVPAGLAYLVAGLIISASWLSRGQRNGFISNTRNPI